LALEAGRWYPFGVHPVLIALADVGPGIQLEEGLTLAGMPATWDASFADGPRGGGTPTVVLVDADHLGGRLTEIAVAWRDQVWVPGVVAIGNSEAARAQAPHAKVTLVSSTASIQTVIAAIREAAKLRLASGMRWAVLRAAVKLPPIDDTPAAWQATLVAARTVDIDTARTALRWHANHYVTPTARLDALREDRLLTVPELAVAAQIDGTLTLQSVLAAGPLDSMQAARLLWTLTSIGALELTPEVRDIATPPRRKLHELRAHLRARAARLERSTFYDVLETTPLAEYPEIEASYRLVALRFAPQVISVFDLADLAGTVQPMWDLVEKARGVLLDHAQRGRYHDWLRSKLPELRSVWAVEASNAASAIAAFARGQRALGDGDVHKAMSELATACRHHPGHPDYEANLAWARYRVQVASGRDRVEAATAERTLIETSILGCRPWPRALVALALLCLAAGDADSARWHLHVALSVDPSVPAAAQLAQRLGMRR